MWSQRRRSSRYPFIAAAELTEPISGARLKASTSDLGFNGCFLDTINPLPQGTIINIQITYQGEVFAAGGVVAHWRPNMGMGVEFIALESGCSSLLETWLHEVGLVRAAPTNRMT
jgi:PilZ domain-containing protein